MTAIRKVLEFEWDKGNIDKPKKHGVTIDEAEEAFFDDNKAVFNDWQHSKKEKRATLLGKTRSERLLNITFTIRRKKIRIITARDINKKEVQLYEKTA
ncbi:MAG: BrnT family toxin [Candidatus Levybacteria bacterium]|nr:BrnT family toxin [Candidatus Levybacteria bacterium]